MGCIHALAGWIVHEFRKRREDSDSVPRIMAQPPAYAQSLLAPVRPDRRNSDRLLLIPYTSISAVQEYNHKIILAAKSTAFPEVYISNTVTFDQFVASYCPQFGILTDQERNSRIAINPHRVIHIFRNVTSETIVSVERVDLNASTILKSYSVKESLKDAHLKVDPVGYAEVVAHRHYHEQP
jgi:hypothetical protein